MNMARREKMRNHGEFVLFDVLYEDGTRSSNRKVPSAQLGGLDGDTFAKPYIEAEDRKIAEVSGRPRGAIKALSRKVVSRKVVSPKAVSRTPLR
jgi:hypothetical protein